MRGRVAALVLVQFVVLLALAILLAPAEAQQAGKVPRIGVLATQSPEVSASYVHALREGLYELGYVESQNITIEWRWAHGRAERYTDLAAELVRLNVDVIVAENNPAITAAQNATRTIPSVMIAATDPVGLRFVASLARPGGNITGLSAQTDELLGKRLQLAREAVPNASRLSYLWDPAEPGRRRGASLIEAHARAAGVQLRLWEARDASDIDNAFAEMTRGNVGAAIIGGSSMLFSYRSRIAELAVRGRLPTICGLREYAEAGCLISYHTSWRHQYRRAAYFVDQILKGAKPADLPVEQPTKFELVINLKTAKALGLTIPPSLLLRADQVIE